MSDRLGMPLIVETEAMKASLKAARAERDVVNRFTYHPPKPGQPDKYTAIRDLALDLAFKLVGLCPDSRELSTALTKLDEVVFFANAAIARNE